LDAVRHIVWVVDSRWALSDILVRISTFVGQNVGQMLGYGIGIAAEFVRQLLKTNVI